MEKNRRILIVDDNETIHADFRKILSVDAARERFAAEEAEIFGTKPQAPPRVKFQIEHAYQGEEALECVQTAVRKGARYAMVFMDVRMPPGWDGVETAPKLWEADPDLQVVICTAYSDYSWDEMMKLIGMPERLLVLKKPFDPIEVLQLAHALTEKWSLLHNTRSNTEALENQVSECASQLQGMSTLVELEISRHRSPDENATPSALGNESSIPALPGDATAEDLPLRRLVNLFHSNTPSLLDQIRDSIARRPTGDLSPTAAVPAMIELQQDIENVWAALNRFNGNPATPDERLPRK